MTIEESSHIEAEVDIHMRVSVKQPSYILYEFDGHIRYYDEKDQLQTNLIGVDSKNLLLKGAKVKNTKWVIGLVVYTGKETKIQLNATNAKSKMSLMEKRLHRMVIAIFVAQVCISIFSSFGRSCPAAPLECQLQSGQLLGLCGEPSSTSTNEITIANDFIDGFTYFLLIQTMIPISLIVNLEIVRMFQAAYLGMNYSMFSVEKNQGVISNCASVNEELGQIQYVLSDKTGTLTQNKMVLRGLFIGDCIFGGNFFEKDDKATFEPFITQERRQRRVLTELDEAFDRRLVTAVAMGEEAPLREPVVLSYHPVKIQIPEFMGMNSRMQSMVKLADKTVTNIIQFHGLDLKDQDTIHKTILKTRSEKKMIIYPRLKESHPLEDESVDKKFSKDGKPSGMVSLEELIEARPRLLPPVKLKETEKHFERLESSRHIEQSHDIAEDGAMSPESPHLRSHVIIESPFEEEGMVLSTYQDIIVEFLMAASLCHECVVGGT